MSEPKTIADFVEMLGLLHDIGKLTDEFLRYQSRENYRPPRETRDFQYFYQIVVDPSTLTMRPDATGGAVNKINRLRADAAIQNAQFPEDAQSPFKIANLAPALGEWAATAPDGQVYTLAEVIDIAHPHNFSVKPRDAWLQATGKAMQPAHLVATMHGIAHYEKEAPSPGGGASVSQPYAQTYRSAPFGDETHIAVGTDDGLSARYKKLAEALTIDKRIKRLAVFKRLLSSGIGDTQRPTNEVTLWDWGYTTASLAKAALAWITRNIWPPDLNAIPFQTLSVTLDRLEQYRNADKISDLLGMRDALDDAYQKVQQIVEEEFALGNQFYHDETGAYFLIPGVTTVCTIESKHAAELDTGKIPESLWECIKLKDGQSESDDAIPSDAVVEVEHVGKAWTLVSSDATYVITAKGEALHVGVAKLPDDLVKRVADCFPDDLQPYVNFGESVSAGELDTKKIEHLSKLVTQPRARAQAQATSTRFDGHNIAHLAATWASDGHARPDNAERCTACGMRPVGYPRSDKLSAELGLPDWVDRDKARRRNICQVCLERRGRTVRRWVSNQMQRTVWTDEVADDNGRLALFVGQLGLDEWLDGSMLQTLAVNASNGVPTSAKNPSPAHLYRIAEAGRDFWSHTTNNLDDVIGKRKFRVALHLADSDLQKLAKDNVLGMYYAYELEFKGVTLSAMWDGQRFISIENLDYFLKRFVPDKEDQLPDKKEDRAAKVVDLLKQTVVDQQCNIMEPTGYGEASFAHASVTIASAEGLEDDYTPVIKLMAEPSICMVLIPADRAIDFTQWVKARYLKEMGRVRDRLPLNIGLVFFPRRTPIRSVLDAGRRMLSMGGEWRWEPWKVSAAEHETTETKLTFQNGVSWAIPTKAGDGVTEDQWYPYFLKAQPADTGSKVAFTGLVHVNDLKPGDTVWVRPSRFDYEFLDSTARTYDIHYAAATGKRSVRPTRPYLLDDLDTLEGMWEELLHLQRTQRYQVVQTIESTWEGWNTNGEDRQQSGVFKQFVADTLAGAAWVKEQPWSEIKKADRNRLIDAGVSGVLADVVELHMQILKEPEPTKNGAPTAK